MQDIPKLYIPIGNSDLSTSSYRLVQEELLNSASVSLKLRPLEQKDLGWGQGPFLNVHLKTSCINTFYELEQQLSGISFHLSRQNRTARLYFQFLIQQQIIPETLGMAYLDWWETLRYSTQEMTEQEFRDFLKLFTGLRRSIPLSL
ncbi:hypothetical protein EDD86DRAFT_189724 [Gorgonomyces haynaldii]|nr:hypothetical protein EDD86DRAFT_189724 [Gorgonomyces haynaldii]